jgi:uncharacterized RDD family membrane protein YckC
VEQVAPGWFPDPTVPATLRWWDGSQWTPMTASATAPMPPRGMPTAMSNLRPTTTPDGVPLADYVQRFLAALIDRLITGLAELLIVLPALILMFRHFVDYLRTADPYAQNGTLDPQMLRIQGLSWLTSLAMSAVGLAVSALNDVVLVRRRSASVGKLIVGLRIRPCNGAVEQLPWSTVWKRWATGPVAAAVAGIYGLVDAAWVLMDDRRQALHDKWPETVVVRR